MKITGAVVVDFGGEDYEIEGSIDFAERPDYLRIESVRVLGEDRPVSPGERAALEQSEEYDEGLDALSEGLIALHEGIHRMREHSGIGVIDIRLRTTTR